MSDSPITKETLEYLADLARIELDPKEEKRILGDLRNILDYISELQKADTRNVAPLNGGTELTNVTRHDDDRQSTSRGAGAGQFPETKDGFLKIPPIFG